MEVSVTCPQFLDLESRAAYNIISSWMAWVTTCCRTGSRGGVGTTGGTYEGCH